MDDLGLELQGHDLDLGRSRGVMYRFAELFCILVSVSMLALVLVLALVLAGLIAVAPDHCVLSVPAM